MVQTQAKEVIKLVPHILKAHLEHLWIDYDKKADVLYINFGKPQEAEDSKLIEEENIILREKKGKLIGLTILNASQFGTLK